MTAQQNPQIFQICYSPNVRPLLDPGFGIAGDESNPRPEWFEYWHIRNFLKSEILDENTFYGFLSPRFKEKTNLSAADVYRFLDKHNDCDVILFSPYLDQSALFLNIIEQGWFAHPELKTIFAEICKRYFNNIDHETLVTTTENTVFCNYFVAKPNFWARWFEICEDIFNLVESGSDPLGREISGETRYKTSTAPMRTFVMERIATLLLHTERHWKSKNHPSYQCAVGKMSVARATTALLALDALKQIYANTHADEYLFSYFNNRLSLLRQTTLPGHLKSTQSPFGAFNKYTSYLLNKMRIDSF